MNKFNAQGKMKQGLESMPKINRPSTTTPESATLTMKTANWPGLPGKSQSKDRSNGIAEEQCYVKAMGLRGGADNDTGESKDS